MKKLINNVPLFPIRIFLLPGGITRLRVFEQRYLKLVSIASEGIGFIIAAPSENQIESERRTQWGSWVHIVNFDTGDDGVLEIDVKCSAIVELTLHQQSKNQKSSNTLSYCNFHKIPHWSEKNSDGKLLYLSESLADLFANNDLLNDLYKSDKQENSYWLVARWLELLPIPFDIKSEFIELSSYKKAKQLINSILISDRYVNN